MTIRIRTLATVGALALAATSLAAATTMKPKLGNWGVDLTGVDKSVKPGEDFNQYVNGSWIKRTQIAPDRTSAGGFVTLTDQAERDVREIDEAAAANPTASPQAQQVGDLYASWMDEAGIEAKGTAPLKPYLARIDAVQSKQDLEKLFMAPGYASPIDIDVGPDTDQPTRYEKFTGQGELAMPRDYYLKAGAKFDTIRAAYHDYLVKINTLAGFPDPAGRADRIMALETKLATDQWSPDARRDVKKNITPMTVADLQKLAPGFDWAMMLGELQLPTGGRIIVSETTALTAAGQRLDDVPLSTWKEYLAYRFVNDHAAYLPKAFDDASFAFYGHTVADQPEQRARWKRGVGLVNRTLGEAVGQLYVTKHYPPEAQRQMAELIEDLRGAYGELIDKAAWMDPATRAQAKIKLAAFDPRIGHPNKYIDYSPLTIRRDDLLGNVIRSSDFNWKLKLKRFPKPVDRTLWDMSPQTVNAYYDPQMNQVTFPAAILQPPFFDPAADPAVNYGAIGVVIGHEMGHGFDDQGREFDAKGQLRDWWTPASSKLYTERTDALGKQYDSYEPLPGLHINGKLTMGENLGDLGGIQAAYAAYQRYQARHGKGKVIDGLTGDQRFYIAYAQVWQNKTREGALRAQLLTNPHSPAEYRINGIVRNEDPWYKAFDVKPGDKLYLPPDQRIKVW